MKKPLKFNKEMQFAVQVGQKTQTRRPIKSLVCPYGEVGYIIELFMEDGVTSFAKAQVMQVQQQQLQNINEEDALHEGVECISNNFGNGASYCDYMLANKRDTSEWYNSAVSSFRSLWISIYGQDNWKYNPTVWVIKFEVLEFYQ